MKKAEIIIGILAILSLVMQLFLLPGSSVLTVLSLSSLAMIYFYFGLLLFNDIRLRNIFKKTSYAGISTPRKTGAIAAGMALSITIVGILFKLQSWPGAGPNLTLGLAALLVVNVVGLIRYSKNKSKYYTGIFTRVLIFGGVGLLLTFTPPATWVQLKYRNHPAYRDALKNAIEDPQNQALWDKVTEERENMDNEYKIMEEEK